jgi:hypothetical protein
VAESDCYLNIWWEYCLEQYSKLDGIVSVLPSLESVTLLVNNNRYVISFIVELFTNLIYYIQND